jgi:glycosyltransferase involved in cell wall biosynthesis/2-polyprenyl-3-methyl-5-hydroxy-6-metoxy-1,4-benzoquinol methylase
MSKLRFVFAIPGLPFHGNSLSEQSLGGSETAALCLMRELVSIGHSVFAFTNTDAPGDYHGVTYLPLSKFREFATTVPHDVCVIQRLPDWFASSMESKLNILWAHDLAMARNSGQVRGVSWNIDKFAVVSDYMAQQYIDTYSFPPEHLYVTRNGIDLPLFPRPGSIKRDPKALVYTSRPERGLDVLLDRIFPELLKRDPEFKLHIAAYDNQVNKLAGFYDEISCKIEAFGDRIVFEGHLPKKNLYQLYAKCGTLVYPTPSPRMETFREVSCITLMEAMASGLPVVTSNLGALPETLAKGAGTLIDGSPMSDEYVTAFCDAVMTYATSEKAAKAASDAGIKAAKKLSWRSVAEDWAKDCEFLIEERNNDKERLAHHFIHRSNIVLAKKLVSELTSESSQRLKARLDREWAFYEKPEDYAQQYWNIGETHTDLWEGATTEPRLRSIIDWIRNHPEIKTIVDVGCGLGAYAINISNALPDIKITGVDIDPHGIEWANKYKAEKALYPDNVTFMVGREDEPLTGFDCALACEILEHVAEPWDFLRKVESMVKLGGYVYLTTPYGPWEAMSYDSYPHRAHLWEYEPADLSDMIGEKQDVLIDYAPYAKCPETNEVLGHFHFSFIADHKSIPPIDIERKLRLQRPRQTVSANIIAGGSSVEETGNWCLRSIRGVVDEIIVADCGLTEEGRKLIEPYADKIIPCASPAQVGFEVARNEILKHSNMDWVLWIDTDERLMNPQGMHRYLRQNIYHGYSIEQHHFAVDTHFPADKPVRFFRRKRTDGKTMRFIGMIHEHPETDLNEGPGDVLILPDVHIAHVGYLNEAIRRGRFMRNHPMLKADVEKYPDRLLQRYFVMRDNMLITQYTLQRNGGQITDEILKLAQDTVDIFRKNFHAKRIYAGIDALDFYRQALILLNKGFDITFSVNAARDGHGDNLEQHSPILARFETLEECQAELAHRIKEKVAPLTVENF